VLKLVAVVPKRQWVGQGAWQGLEAAKVVYPGGIIQCLQSNAVCSGSVAKADEVLGEARGSGLIEELVSEIKMDRRRLKDRGRLRHGVRLSPDGVVRQA
jgi:hypothetical protein